MNALAFLLLGVLVLAVGFVAYRCAAATAVCLKFREKRLIVCPETQKPAAVDVAAGHVAAETLIGQGRSIGIAASPQPFAANTPTWSWIGHGESDNRPGRPGPGGLSLLWFAPS